jgi:hypothetical protein
VDHFVLKRGNVYATVLVDMDSHRPVDVRPDRPQGLPCVIQIGQWGLPEVVSSYDSGLGRRPVFRRRHGVRHSVMRGCGLPGPGQPDAMLGVPWSCRCRVA